MPTIVIDNRAIAQHALRLKQMHRSVLPVAIRQTLNKAAMDVKQNTMPAEAGRFEKRKPTFLKAASKVDFAKGFDPDTMKATAGFVPKTGDKSHSVEDLEQQEDGGLIANRSFIPLASARSGKSWGRMVRMQFRMSLIRDKIIDANDVGASFLSQKKQQFIKSAIHAKKGGFVIGTNKNQKGNRLLMYINSVKRIGRKTVVNSTPIYAVKANRKVSPDSRYHHFMKKASNDSAAKMTKDFIEIAEKKLKGIK